MLAPPVDDDRVELTTWSSGRGVVAAARRLSLVGDRSGRVELDSTWVHLGPDARPARLDDFGPYAESAAERVVTTRLELSEPSPPLERTPWPLRSSDLDRLGHVNNAAYWHAVEHRLAKSGLDASRPLRARLDHLHALDLGDEVELVESTADGTLALAFTVEGRTRAVALVERLEP